MRPGQTQTRKGARSSFDHARSETNEKHLCAQLSCNSYISWSNLFHATAVESRDLGRSRDCGSIHWGMRSVVVTVSPPQGDEQNGAPEHSKTFSQVVACPFVPRDHGRSSRRRVARSMTCLDRHGADTIGSCWRPLARRSETGSLIRTRFAPELMIEPQASRCS